MNKKIGILCLSTLLLAGCGAPKLENGQEAVVTFKDDAKISVDDLYEKVKNDYALESLINMIDTYIFETEFKDYIPEAKTKAENYVKGSKESFDSTDAYQQALQQSGFANEKAFQNYMYLNYMQSHAIEEYAHILVTDKDIETYYNDKAKGDLEISHILISPEVKDDMTDDEKQKAEDNAKNKAEKLLKEILAADNKKDAFEKAVKDNSDDEATKDKKGAFEQRLTYGDLPDTYDAVFDAAYKIKDGEIYTKVVKTDLGYHIIMRTKSYEKESLKDLKDEIKDILAQDLLDNTKDISIKALEYYRKEYDLDIKDSELKKQYDNYIKRVLASYNTNTEE